MRITSRGEYGLRALLDLAQRYGSSVPVTQADIAARQQIPEAYLNQLLTALRKTGLVRSVRGPEGGHMMRRSPAHVTVAEAVIALEGSISPAKGLDRPPAPGEPLEAEVLREVWRDVQSAIGQVLESITLDDLCQRKLARERQIMYYI
ncbi:MAG TPA: Rrf2 family transcriptional regulator [Anaerolineae bacterium]|nr:Rrf2 family transcriptional regulator [Anaerolineae bacterium]